MFLSGEVLGSGGMRCDVLFTEPSCGDCLDKAGQTGPVMTRAMASMLCGGVRVASDDWDGLGWTRG